MVLAQSEMNIFMKDMEEIGEARLRTIKKGGTAVFGQLPPLCEL